jgi:hypothetical protein
VKNYYGKGTLAAAKDSNDNSNNKDKNYDNGNNKSTGETPAARKGETPSPLKKQRPRFRGFFIYAVSLCFLSVTA